MSKENTSPEGHPLCEATPAKTDVSIPFIDESRFFTPAPGKKSDTHTGKLFYREAQDSCLAQIGIW